MSESGMKKDAAVLKFLCFFSTAAILVSVLSCSREPVVFNSDEVSLLNRFLDENAGRPSSLVTAELKNGKDVVFLPDSPFRADSIFMVKAILPAMYDSGLRNMGVFFLPECYQKSIDSIILGPYGDDETACIEAEKLVSAALMGYEEYRDFILYVRDFNRNLPEEKEALHLWGLNASLGGTEDSEDGKDYFDVDAGSDKDAERLESNAGSEDKPGTLAGRLRSKEGEPVFLWLNKNYADSGDSDLFVSIGHFGPGEEGPLWGGILEHVLEERKLPDRSFSFRPSEPPFQELQNKEVLNQNIMIVTPFPITPVTQLENFEDKNRSASKYKRHLKKIGVY